MEASVIYHDGEEVEVGWFGLMLYRLRGFWRTCKQTDWKNYFQGNGPDVYKRQEWMYSKELGFSILKAEAYRLKR